MEKSEFYLYKAITSIIALIATPYTFWTPYNYIIVNLIHLMHMLDHIQAEPGSEVQ
jgi:hypothetical protein